MLKKIDPEHARELMDFLTLNENWHEYFQHDSVLPGELFRDHKEVLQLCIDCGLIAREGGLHLRPARRINRLMIRDRRVLIATDFPSSQTAARIFPWTDEAEVLVDRVLSRYRGHEPPRKTLDLCTGAGTIALALAKEWGDQCELVVGSDVLARAIDQATWNRWFNKHFQNLAPRIEFVQADLFQCTESDSTGGRARWEPEDAKVLMEQEFDLIVADPPFRIGPPSLHGADYSHSLSGSEEMRLSMDIAANARARLTTNGRLVLLTYALDTVESPPVRFVEEIMRAFYGDIPQNALNLVSHAGRHIWRFGEHKSVPRNPMPIEYTIIRVPQLVSLSHRRARHDAGEEPLDGRWACEEWTNWAEALKDVKKTHIHYLCFDLPRDPQSP